MQHKCHYCGRRHKLCGACQDRLDSGKSAEPCDCHPLCGACQDRLDSDKAPEPCDCHPSGEQDELYTKESPRQISLADAALLPATVAGKVEPCHRHVGNERPYKKCGGTLIETPYQFGLTGYYCPKCGADYFTGDELDKLRNLSSTDRKIKVELTEAQADALFEELGGLIDMNESDKELDEDEEDFKYRINFTQAMERVRDAIAAPSKDCKC